MSRDLYIEPGLASRGRRKPVKGGDLDNATLNAGNEVTIWSKQVNADNRLWWGHGTNNRERGPHAFIYAQLFANGNGTGTDGDALVGELVAVITDSDQKDVIARREVGDLETLADAQSDNRTERPLFPSLAPYATEDKHIELRVNADSGSDGAEVANDSNVRMYYSKERL